jgi:hypothetical protein
VWGGLPLVDIVIGAEVFPCMTESVFGESIKVLWPFTPFPYFFEGNEILKCTIDHNSDFRSTRKTNVRLSNVIYAYAESESFKSIIHYKARWILL